jgi:hypothetical protein
MFMSRDWPLTPGHGQNETLLGIGMCQAPVLGAKHGKLLIAYGIIALVRAAEPRSGGNGVACRLGHPRQRSSATAP